MVPGRASPRFMGAVRFGPIAGVVSESGVVSVGSSVGTMIVREVTSSSVILETDGGRQEVRIDSERRRRRDEIPLPKP